AGSTGLGSKGLGSNSKCDPLEPAFYRVSDLEDAPPGPKRLKSSRGGGMRGLLGGDDAPGQTPQWVLSLPPDFTQTERSVAARGVNPCMSPDPGFGDYGAWDHTPSLGQMLVPQKLERDADGKVA